MKFDWDIQVVEWGKGNPNPPPKWNAHAAHSNFCCPAQKVICMLLKYKAPEQLISIKVVIIRFSAKHAGAHENLWKQITPLEYGLKRIFTLTLSTVPLYSDTLW